MHIVGLGKSDDGKTFYHTKNSWGTNSSLKGYLYVSPDYFKLKTIAIMVHKDAIPADIRLSLGL
jgi:bleomycin hydrolase